MCEGVNSQQTHSCVCENISGRLTWEGRHILKTGINMGWRLELNKRKKAKWRARLYLSASLTKDARWPGASLSSLLLFSSWWTITLNREPQLTLFPLAVFATSTIKLTHIVCKLALIFKNYLYTKECFRVNSLGLILICIFISHTYIRVILTLLW